MKRRITPEVGMNALRQWRDGREEAPREVLLTAVRYALEELGTLYPGRAVEVRVPPAGAVQILQGTVHRRGTPPAVIETDMRTWLELTTGEKTWVRAEEEHLLDASGERADLSPYLPLFTRY